MKELKHYGMILCNVLCSYCEKHNTKQKLLDPLATPHKLKK